MFDPKVIAHVRGAEAGKYHQAETDFWIKLPKEASIRETDFWIKLPKEASIREVVTTREWIDDSFVIKFALPTTKRPELWLKQVWSDNKFAANSREGRYEYSAYHSGSNPHGYRCLKYLPKERIYVAEIGTD